MTNHETKTSILLVEDEENLQEALRLNLELEGYQVTTADTGVEALKAISREFFQLVILDIMLPGMDGIAVCENIRLQNNDVPILFLSAKNTSQDRVLGLKKGGDDYITKPFDLEELLLRIAKLIEKSRKIRGQVGAPDVYHFGGGSIDFAAQVCTGFDGETHTLSRKEAMFLRLLVENKGKVVPREKILQVIWGYNVYPNTRTIDNFILDFRKYFEKDSRKPRFFHSVRGVGYMFTE